MVKKKVKLLSLMAGAFEKIPDGKGNFYDHKEYNVVEDIPSAKRLVKNWPVEMVWSGFEIGLTVPYPHQSILKDYRYVEHHPLAEAYILYMPPPHDRPTWDLTSVLYGVRPDHGYYQLSEPGVVAVGDDGLTTFASSKEGKHRYLKLTPELRIRLSEALVQLSSQPPEGKR